VLQAAGTTRMAVFDPATDVVTLEASRTCIVDDISSVSRGMCLTPYYDGSGRRRQALESNGTDAESGGDAGGDDISVQPYPKTGGRRRVQSVSLVETGLRFQVSEALVWTVGVCQPLP
jgi:hypothetical protein